MLCTLRCLARWPWTGSTGWPAFICAITVRWPGMIQKNTLALIAVAIIAPTSRNAARPAKKLAGEPRRDDDEHEDQHADDQVAAFGAAPKTRQIAS